MTRRAALLGLAGLAVTAAAAYAQLVPLARCHAAIPCSIPYGLRPPDAVKNLPDAQLGNSLIGIGIDGSLKPRIVASPISSDFSEDAARIFVKKNPLQPKAATPTPTPAPKPAASGPKDLQLP